MTASPPGAPRGAHRLVGVLGLVLAALSAAPPASAAGAEAPWQGSINAAFTSVAGELHRWAGPLSLAGKAAQFGGHVDPDLSALPTGELNILYGAPAGHPALDAVLSWHHIVLDAEGVTVGSTRLAVHDPFLIAALPMPGHPERPVLVYAAWSAAALPTLNTVFHGPTPLVVGRHEGGALETAYQGGLILDAAGHVERLPSGAPELSAEEAREDLHALVASLERGWAGLEDLDLTLQSRGSSWAARQAEAEAALSSQPAYTWEAVHSQLRRLLDGAQDTHFSLRGQVIRPDGELVSVDDRFVRRLRPCFFEGRLRSVEGAWRFDGEPGAPLLEPLPGPDAVAEGVVYRFPTLLPGGEPAALLGLFTAAAECPATAALWGAERPVHAPRSAFRGDWEPWRIEPGAAPVLSVRTMQEGPLEGLSATARSLRGADRLILDLRMNGGGSDLPAYRWVNRLRAGPYRWAPGANLRPGEAARAERWRQWGERRHRALRRRGGFDGQLFVLTDNDVYSAGETFVQLAAQVPGARVVGLNTAGCARYGNIEAHAPLPHTGLVATFGHTLFDWSAIRDEVEGVGIFPDLWLDEADPVAFLRALP